MSVGPDSPTVLTIKHEHRPNDIWEGNDPGVLTIRSHSHMKDWTLGDRLIPYIVSAKLYDVSSSESVDHALVTVLVEQ